MKLSTLVLLLSSFQCFSQIDTAHISQLIKGLHSIEDHKRFWKEMYYRDQHFRGKLANLTNDENNLVTVSYYFNAYGFPDKKNIGQESSIITAVWGHNRPEIVQKLTFPIIIESHKRKVMDDISFRQYWQGFYKQSYNDDNYKNKPLLEIFEMLNINASNRINIPELVTTMNEYNDLINEPKEIIGQWKAPDNTRTADFNGKPYDYVTKGFYARIYKHTDKRYFIEFHPYLNIPSEGVPLELIAKTNTPLRFETKNKHNPTSYEIDKNGDLIFRDGKGKEILYKKI